MVKKRSFGNVLCWLGKGAASVLLCVLLGIVIGRDFSRVQERFLKYYAQRKAYPELNIVEAKARMFSLNSLIPKSFDDIIALSERGGERERGRVKEYLDYYERVVEYMPQQADAYAMLGFCYDAVGEKEKAFFSYQVAARMAPSFFWHLYNMGVMYYREGQYAEANRFLKLAVNQKPEDGLQYFLTSKIYSQIRGGSAAIPYFMRNLRKGYRDSYEMMVWGFYRLKEFPAMLTEAMAALQAQFNQEGDFYYYAGIAAYEMESYNMAIPLLKEGLKRNYAAGDIYEKLYESLKSAGKDQESEKIRVQKSLLPQEQKAGDGKEKNFSLRIF